VTSAKISDIRTPLWRSTDQQLVGSILELLAKRDTDSAEELTESIARHIRLVNGLGKQLEEYPSIFMSMDLAGHNHRNADTLVERLAKATPFTLDLMLPMRAITGKTFLLARLNFMRMLIHVVRSELNEATNRQTLLDAIHTEISRCVLAQVCEELLMAVICRRDIPVKTRQRAALGLTYLWEDRIHFPMREFFPVLEATWEARRRILVTYGTLSGTAEIFDLMAKGCDEQFVDYFTRDNISGDAVMAFREFLFGLSTEELTTLEEVSAEKGEAVVTAMQVSETLDPQSLTVNTDADVATQLYTFFMKRHLEATARAIGNLEGPKHTAEEYVLLEFLERHNPSIFGEEGLE
jgi:hypothetical protein